MSEFSYIIISSKPSSNASLSPKPYLQLHQKIMNSLYVIFTLFICFYLELHIDIYVYMYSLGVSHVKYKLLLNRCYFTNFCNVRTFAPVAPLTSKNEGQCKIEQEGNISCCVTFKSFLNSVREEQHPVIRKETAVKKKLLIFRRKF